MDRRRRLEALEHRSPLHQVTSVYRLVVQLVNENADEAVARYEAESGEEEATEYFFLQLVASAPSDFKAAWRN